MFFPFTFKLSVPGLFNPFSAPNKVPEISPGLASEALDCINRNFTKKSDHSRRRLSPSPSPSLGPSNSRKRGWEPSNVEPIRTKTTLASSSGYLDTPAKYRQLASASHDDEFDEIEAMSASNSELPPAKRRRGLAGSIVSTAFSAAVIGTAVGLTVYRLWRDRGKEPEQLPPPPYQAGDWTPESQTKPTTSVHVTPATPRRRTRHAVGSASKRTTPRKARTRVPHATSRSTSPYLAPQPIFAPVQPEFNFAPEESDPNPVEDKMDWIGDKLAMLIQEGNKALGREIVVMSESRDDEVDDGTGDWEEEQPSQPRSSRSSSPMRHKRPKPLAAFPPAGPVRFHPSSASPTRSRFEIGSSSSPMNVPLAPSTPQSLPASYKEEPDSWASPEMRASMERARAMALQNRGS